MRGFWSYLEPPLVVLDVLRRSSSPPTNFKAFMFTISAMSVLSALGNAALGSSVSSRDSIRVGCSVSVDGLLRVGSLQYLSIIDGVLIGIAVSIAGACELGSNLRVARLLTIGSTTLIDGSITCR